MTKWLILLLEISKKILLILIVLNHRGVISAVEIMIMIIHYISTINLKMVNFSSLENVERMSINNRVNN